MGKEFSVADREVPTDHFEKKALFRAAAIIEPKSQAPVEQNDGPSGFQPSVRISVSLERLSEANPFLFEDLALASEVLVGEEFADAKSGQVVELAINGVAGELESAALRPSILIAACLSPTEPSVGPVVDGVGEGSRDEEGSDLGFERLERNKRLPASVVEASLGAVVVGVRVAVAVDLVAGGDRESALSAAEHARVGELMGLPSGSAWSTEEILHSVEFVERDHRRVLAWVEPTLKRDHTCVEGVDE